MVYVRFGTSGCIYSKWIHTGSVTELFLASAAVPWNNTVSVWVFNTVSLAAAHNLKCTLTPPLWLFIISSVNPRYWHCWVPSAELISYPLTRHWDWYEEQHDRSEVSSCLKEHATVIDWKSICSFKRCLVLRVEWLLRRKIVCLSMQCYDVLRTFSLPHTVIIKYIVFTLL